MTNDKAGRDFWNTSWSDNEQLPSPANPHVSGLRNYVTRRFHNYFVEAFSRIERANACILEIGCAKSKWLPYFAKEFGFEIYGLDYSEIGCQQEQEILARAGLRGQIICRDLFSPPKDLQEKFDIVISFGVVEHFEDTTNCVITMARYLKPGGIMITLIPNMAGYVGAVQRKLSQSVFDTHVVFDASKLASYHETAGLKVINSNYFLSTHFGVCNLKGVHPYSFDWFGKKILLSSLIAFSAAVWRIEMTFGPFRSSKQMSPYAICLAQKS